MSAHRWVVSSGAYSDYRVVCVCDSKKRAQTVAAAMRGDPDGYRGDARVEQLPFVNFDPEKVPVYHRSVVVMDNGTTTSESQRVSYEWPFDQWEPLDPVSWRWVRAPVYAGKGGRLDVRGTDEERVNRVFSDRRAQLLAEDAFRRSPEKQGRA